MLCWDRICCNANVNSFCYLLTLGGAMTVDLVPALVAIRRQYDELSGT